MYMLRRCRLPNDSKFMLIRRSWARAALICSYRSCGA
jgi:hypothetical protein